MLCNTMPGTLETASLGPIWERRDKAEAELSWFVEGALVYGLQRDKQGIHVKQDSQRCQKDQPEAGWKPTPIRTFLCFLGATQQSPQPWSDHPDLRAFDNILFHHIQVLAGYSNHCITFQESVLPKHWLWFNEKACRQHILYLWISVRGKLCIFIWLQAIFKKWFSQDFFKGLGQKGANSHVLHSCKCAKNKTIQSDD